MSKFTKENVAGDGSCYFHAVTGFLEMEKLVRNKKTYYKKVVNEQLRIQFDNRGYCQREKNISHGRSDLVL